MVCLFKKTADVSVDVSSVEPTLEHRRLRFSFQINDFKDREPPERPDRLAPGCGGGGDALGMDDGVSHGNSVPVAALVGHGVSFVVGGVVVPRRVRSGSPLAGTLESVPSRGQRPATARRNRGVVTDEG